MADKTLRLIFTNSVVETKTVTISVPLADDSKDALTVKAVMDILYDNREIFNLDIGAPKAAAFVNPLTLDYLEIAGL